MDNQIDVMVADASHEMYVDIILETITAAAKIRGTGIAKRTHEYVAQKMKEGKAIIALDGEEFAGFCYIESWGNKQYVANSGLIVVEKYRGHGLAKRIKQAAFTLSRLRWPNAKLFGLTSGGPVMKINTELGYVPVPFVELTDDESFWKGCEGCCNHDVLERTGRKYCICTAMLYDPKKHEKKQAKKETDKEKETE
ncbi:N-acetyltransferase [Bacteroides sp. 214]|uniref:GNAT family N-acetyltransferase n=1 Tax=Bacteroides sp. 214 TaxID=2302935 RepID=UPI0013CFF91A|nr:GNAT family N-acetyltransferase [Bacteroides sp. 214]NDW12609.1 N-acetyltransferase [Bacteroides sp. 214]